MDSTAKQKHIVDFLFPISILFVFTITAIIVIFFAANIYKDTVENSFRNDSTMIATSYINQKIHSSDGDKIDIEDFHNRDALTIRGELDGNSYVTYIYSYNGQILELTTVPNTETILGSGTPIEESDLSMEMLSRNQIKVTCIDRTKKETTSIIGIRSEN